MRYIVLLLTLACVTTSANVYAADPAATTAPATNPVMQPALVQVTPERLHSLASTLQTLASQIELYRIQHQNAAPTLQAMIGWQALLQTTTTDGAVVPGAPFGPYLTAPPPNPFTGKAAMVETGKATLDAGWTYDGVTGRIRAVVPASIAGAFERPNADHIEVAK